jgi:hypothetical protein
MVDIRGFPLSTEQGARLVSNKEAYPLSEYGKDCSPSVVLSDESQLRVVEQFPQESEVSRSLLGVDRKVTQQGLFGNVSTYGLDSKDWRVDYTSSVGDVEAWWRLRPSAGGNYFYSKYSEDSKNSSIVLSANPTPFLEPARPSIKEQIGESAASTQFGKYVNSVVALYIFKYLAENKPVEYRFNYLLSKYPLNNGGFNRLYWDKIWLDISQDRFGALDNYPLLPSFTAYNFKNVTLTNWRTAALWGSANVLIPGGQYPSNLDVSWNSFFFGSARFYFPDGSPDNYGHFKIKTNPVRDIWEKYFGLDWDELRTDLKNWEFTVHSSESTVTQLEKDLKLPYIVLNLNDTSPVTFSPSWPEVDSELPTLGNQIGGRQGISSEVTLKSNRAFRYQPGRISGFTFGVRLSEIGAGPGTILEFGAENDTDSYMFRLTNGSNLSVVRKSTIPLNSTTEKTILANGITQYETVIEQNSMNGDPLSGSGVSGYVLNPDTVTMYKVEFGWYGAIGAKFYAYVPVGNSECRWVTLHTIIIENKLDKPCLTDPFFHFKYRLKISDSSSIRLEQTVSKFGASYYIDGYDEGTSITYNVQSKSQSLRNPQLSGSKTKLNAIDWTTVLGIKPKQFSNNGIYNRREVFPQSIEVFSQTDCEIRVVKQTGCPEWAYSHQEGYVWNSLPESRRLKSKFIINPYFTSNNTTLGISASDSTSHSAIATYNSASSGSFRDPRTSSNWDVATNQNVRVVGQDLYALLPAETKDFTGGSLVVKLQRDGDERFYLSSRTPDIDLDWVRDKLEIPSLEKVAMPDLSAPDMAESDGEVEDLGRIVQGEKAISQLVARNSLSAAENLDFTEFDENGDLKDQTVRDKVSKLIADRFNQGGIDEVGWERIATGISSVDSESSRINLDGYTSPGDIIFTTKRLLDELRAIPRVIPEDRDMLRRELVIFENKALVGEKFTPEDINNLVKVYTLSYRLNRSAVHGECVVLDPDKTGYWSFFAPYFM